jgi:hypothetical protein
MVIHGGMPFKCVLIDTFDVKPSIVLRDAPRAEETLLDGVEHSNEKSEGLSVRTTREPTRLGLLTGLQLGPVAHAWPRQ